jgi:hypothetical protein
LAQRRHFCTTFQVCTSRRRCAKPHVGCCAFCQVCQVFSFSTLPSFRTVIATINLNYL